MYNEKLEALITAALADGVLTDKEKNLLFKKAETMGIDRDEFELVLDGRLAKRKKEMEAQALGLNVDEVDLYIDAQQQKADQAVAAVMNQSLKAK